MRTQVKSILSKLEVRSQLAAVLLLHRPPAGPSLTAPAQAAAQAAALAASARRASWTSRAWRARRSFGVPVAIL